VLVSDQTPEQRRKVPDGYAWPGADAVADATEPLYWLAWDEDSGATPRFTVIAAMPEGQHIAAQGCYLQWGVRIVDALRVTKTGVR
jgi:hypothetical protein